MATRMKKVETDVDTSVDVELKVNDEPKKALIIPDYVLCHSVTAGGLNINCRSGNFYEFKNYGSECEIEKNDLIALIRKSSDHIFMPRIIIDDDAVLNEFPQVKRLYDSLYTSKDLLDVLELSVPQMKETIDKLPKGAKDSLKSLAATQIANGKIDSIKKVRALTEIYDSDFNLLSELFG